MNIMEFLNELIPAQVLGWAVIHTLWIGMLIWLVYTIGKSIITRSVALKYYWALSMQALLFFSFAGALIYESVNSTNSNTTIASAISNENIGFQLINANTNSFDISALSESGISALIDASTPLISVIWIFGALFMIMRFSANLFYIQNIRQTGIQNVDDYWTKKFNFLIDTLNIKTKIDLLESQMIDSPMTIGHFKPLVLIPAGMISQLPIEQVEAILLHELAHIKRSDYLVNMLQNSIESLLFFHPVTWILSSNIRIERENLCDDYSINTQRDPIHLAKALFEIQKNVCHVPGLALGSNGSKYLLKKRIERLFNKQNSKSGIDKSIVPAAFVMLFLLGISVFQYSKITAADSHGIMVENSSMPDVLEISDNLESNAPQLQEKVEIKDYSVVEEKLVTNLQEDRAIKGTTKVQETKSSENSNSNTISISAGDNEITVKKTSDSGQKIEVVFSSPDDIQKLKIDGKKIKPEEFDQYKELLDKEVFNTLLKHDKTKSISYSYSFDDGGNQKVRESHGHGETETIVVKSDKGNQNKIIVKIDTDGGETEVIEIPGSDMEIIEIEEIMEDVMSDIDIQLDFDGDEFSKEIVESIKIESLEKNLEEVARALEQTSKELEEKSKALKIELDDVKMEEVEEAMKKAIKEIQVEIEHIRDQEKEMSNKEKSYKVKVVALENTQKEASAKMDKIITELEKDGIIEKNSNKIEVEFKKGIMTVNGEKQSDDIAKKYINMLDIDESANIQFIKTKD